MTYLRVIRVSFLAVLVLIVAGGMPFAIAQSGDFLVSQNGHDVGTASFQFTGNADGYESTSVVKVSMQGLDYALSKTEELDASNRVRHVILSGTVNGTAVNLVGKPDGANFLLNTSANGRSSTSRLELHPASVFLPDFDPGGLETLLALAVQQGNRDLWAIIPKQAGSVDAVQLATYPDEQGTLDGRAIAVHHMVATIGQDQTELFSGPENQLLQAELEGPGFALVRKGFVLTPPKKPLAPTD
ncbi:MAG TPA: hypothetical protein VKB38_18830 [Terracidiphilus sp.]|nr:hypothetical protein [Terracidiphilus sp.]